MHLAIQVYHQLVIHHGIQLAGIALTSDQFEKCDIRSKEILNEYVPTILMRCQLLYTMVYY